ncbi:MAG: protease modulator HflC [Candidatus Cloacimonetes bacterium]|nr:protease modulator HflC [Candidatus Cloacimonadota bacterium]
MKATTLIILGIILLIVIVNALYIVDETQQAIITQFGEPIGEAKQEAGLYIKTPFIQKVHYFEKRILQWDGEQNQIPTQDKKFIWVDTFARWRIIDPLLFYQSVRSEIFAQSRLDDIIDGVTRDIITLNPLIEIVRDTDREMSFAIDFDADYYEEIQADIMVGRRTIADSIYAIAHPLIDQFGIELIDVQIKRVNYIEDVRKQVYERMSSERKKIADRYRSSGQGRAAEIIGRMERELQQIESEAYRTSQEISGRADAEATTIYAGAYNRDPQFFEFLRTMDAYKKTMNEKNTLIMTTDSDFYKFMKKGN